MRLLPAQPIAGVRRQSTRPYNCVTFLKPYLLLGSAHLTRPPLQEHGLWRHACAVAYRSMIPKDSRTSIQRSSYVQKQSEIQGLPEATTSVLLLSIFVVDVRSQPILRNLWLVAPSRHEVSMYGRAPVATHLWLMFACFLSPAASASRMARHHSVH